MAPTESLTLTGDGTAPVSRMRLRQFIFAGMIAVMLLLGLSAIAEAVKPSVWTTGVIALLALNGIVYFNALRWVDRGDSARAVTVISALLWVSAVVGSYLSPFTLPIHVVAALLPAIFVVPYVDRRRLPLFSCITIASVFVSGLVAAPHLAAMAHSPGPAQRSVAIETVAMAGLPIVAIMIVIVVWHTATTLQDIAAAARRNAAALAVSQDLLARRAEQLAASRARMVAAVDAERKRLERDLHDGAQQDLVAVA